MSYFLILLKRKRTKLQAVFDLYIQYILVLSLQMVGFSFKKII